MDPGTAALAAAFVSAGTQLVGGGMGAVAARQQASVYEDQARRYDLQAKQISAQHRSRLESALASVSAVRASRNVQANTPSSAAIERRLIQESREAEASDVLGARFRRLDAKRNAAAKRRAAWGEAISGIGSAGSSLISSFGTGGGDG